MKVFKVGDKARVRKDLVGGGVYDTCTSGGCSGGCYCTEMMTNYAGDVVVVSKKDDRTGFMLLRNVEDGFTTEMPFSWSDGMLEPLENRKKEEKQQHGFLTVGSVVKIRSDISKRVDSKNRIWITLDGKKCPSIHVSNEIKESGDKAVVITEVFSRPGHMDGCTYLARFAGSSDNKNIEGLFDIAMFNCLKLKDWLLERKDNEPSDDKAKKGFKVGDKVVIKTTVSQGDFIDNITIQHFIFNQAYDKSDPSRPRRKIGTVAHVYKSGALGIRFEHEVNEFTWPQCAFELYDVRMYDDVRW